ncbi:MAG: glycerol-3-phosphate acyltransferase [Anaerolineae bacterium]|jgi:glycerol-3-phosphate acyltransferase PlsY|nr:glycerol-3-phosphate acyltransferase [Anaerolineae bacterium]
MVWFLGAVIGYLSGSISFARIIFSWKRPGEQFPVLKFQIPNSDVEFVSTSSGATTIFDALGGKWGGITGLLDILKALLPTLAARLFFPESLLYLVVGFFAVLGHNYPVYHRFKGGRGSSTITGVLLVMDWLGTLMTTLVGLVIGILSGQVNTARWYGRMLMIPYTWFVHQNIWMVLFVVGMNVLFFLAMWEEISQLAKLKKQGLLPDTETVAEISGVGSMYRLSQKYSIPALIKRRKK